MTEENDQPPRAKRRPNKTALQYAVKLLSARPYSERKLRDKLGQHKFERDEIHEALLRLRKERLLDDEKFAEDFVQTRLASRPRATTALVRDLLARGIPMDVARKVVSAMVEPNDELAAARILVKKRWEQYSALDAQTRWRRLGGLLARRGFSPGMIRKVLREAERDVFDEE